MICVISADEMGSWIRGLVDMSLRPTSAIQDLCSQKLLSTLPDIFESFLESWETRRQFRILQVQLVRLSSKICSKIEISR